MPSTTSSSPNDYDHRRPPVLIVNDEENTLPRRSALQLASFETEVAETGQEAMKTVESFRPDAVVLDVRLPDVDGFTVLKRLRDRDPSIQVIFLTARDATEDRVRGLTSGGADYQVKPFAVAELVARVRLRVQEADSGTRTLRRADLDLDTDAPRPWEGHGTTLTRPCERPSCKECRHGQGSPSWHAPHHHQAPGLPWARQRDSRGPLASAAERPGRCGRIGMSDSR